MNVKPKFSEHCSWIQFNTRAVLRPITMPAVSSNDFPHLRHFKWTRAKLMTALVGLILTISSTVRADWTSLNPGVLRVNNSVSGFAVDDSSNLYVGGYFTLAGTVSANYIAKWDGTTWSALGPGPKGNVCALALSGPNLYAAGYFTNAGGVVTNSVLKWDGTTWSALGSGMNDVVFALAVSGTNLYAGGSFTNAGGVTAKYIARWDGSKWSALGSGMSGGDSPYVYALAISGTNLYAGGTFTNAGGAIAVGFAKWDGNAWSAVGSGLGGTLPYVYSLAVSGTDLYVGGSFTYAGGLSAVGIAKWDGNAWSNVGSGLGNPGDYTGTSIGSLAISGTNLYAGGYLSPPGDSQVYNGVAKWDGSGWSPLATRLDGSVFALAASGTNFYAGGYFLQVGDRAGNSYLASWDGNEWLAMDSWTGGAVYALAADGTNLFAGGQPGPTSLPGVAQWDGNGWSSPGTVSGPGVYDLDVEVLTADGWGHLFVGGNFYLADGITSPFIVQMNLPSAPIILTPPQSQTAEVGSTVDITLDATGYPAVTYFWFFNETNLIGSGTNCWLQLTDCQPARSGTYTVVVTNAYGAVTTAPISLNVIAAVERRAVPGIKLTGEVGAALNVEYAESLDSGNWLTLDRVNLTNLFEFWFDLTEPLPSQRFYRAEMISDPIVGPVLDLHLVPAITLAGSVGDTLRLDYINAIGPTDAWVTLDTLTVTNTSQLYFDTSSIGQPRRLYRIVPGP
jgi:Immunoglobulin domain